MIVKTKLAEQAEQFQIGQEHYVGRRVLCESSCGLDTIDVMFDMEDDDETIEKPLIAFQLDYDRGLIFVDPSILRPYQRPERKEND